MNWPDAAGTCDAGPLGVMCAYITTNLLLLHAQDLAADFAAGKVDGVNVEVGLPTEE